MSAIQLQIILADGSLRRETFAQSPVTFGREADNHITFTHPLISRKHGVFHQDDEGWLIENISDNGTWLNGKRIKRKPLTLRQGDVISVGDHDIFRVEAILESATGATPTASPAVNTTPVQPKPEVSASVRKMRLWIGLASFWVVVLALLIFIQPLYNSRSSTGSQWRTPELTQEAISQAVRQKPRDIAGRLQPNDRRAADYLAEARDIASRLDANIDAPFRAYRAYQRAMAHAGKHSLDDSRDLRTFTEIESRLIDQANQRYRDAYAMMRSHNFRDADIAFRNLTLYFPDPQNPLIRNVESLRKEIANQRKRLR